MTKTARYIYKENNTYYLSTEEITCTLTDETYGAKHWWLDSNGKYYLYHKLAGARGQGAYVFETCD